MLSWWLLQQQFTFSLSCHLILYQFGGRVKVIFLFQQFMVVCNTGLVLVADYLEEKEQLDAAESLLLLAHLPTPAEIGDEVLDRNREI
jgi:hypothetical protein